MVVKTFKDPGIWFSTLLHLVFLLHHSVPKTDKHTHIHTQFTKKHNFPQLHKFCFLEEVNLKYTVSLTVELIH